MIERWIKIPYIYKNGKKVKYKPGGKRRDYLGFGDILAFDNFSVMLVQSCGTNFSEHRKAMLDNKNIKLWLNGGGRKVWLIGWRKVKKKRGGKLMVYRERIARFCLINGELDCHEINEIY